MQPCFDFRNGFSCSICVDFQLIPKPQEKRSFVELPIIVPSPTVGPVSAHHRTGLRSSSSRRTFDACKWQRPITRSHPIESRLT